MIISPVHNNIPEMFPFQILKWWCSACHLRLICGWLSSLFQISFIASRGKTWAEMINTIKAVHLSTVADGAAFHGAKRSLFTAAADKMQLGINSVWAHKDVHFFLIFILLSARKSVCSDCNKFLHFSTCKPARVASIHTCCGSACAAYVLQ